MWVCKIFERSLLCSPRLHLFNQVYSKKHQYIYKNIFFICLKASHNSSGIILICWFGIILLSMLKMLLLNIIFIRLEIIILFLDSLMNIIKQCHLFEIQFLEHYKYIAHFHSSLDTDPCTMYALKCCCVCRWWLCWSWYAHAVRVPLKLPLSITMSWPTCCRPANWTL